MAQGGSGGRVPKSGGHGGGGQLRLIGGRWRGRKLPIPQVPGLRPTPDRVRETLFNWLMGEIVDAHVLDLYCGSGALGLEALSRGAATATFVDAARAVNEQMRANLALLQLGPEARMVQAEANVWLSRTPATPHHLVFLDPPYRKGLVHSTCEQLERHGWLAPGALVYVEAEAELDPLPLPEGWAPLKGRVAGQVGYHLYRVGDSGL